MKHSEAILATLVGKLELSALPDSVKPLFLARLGARFSAIAEGFRKLYGDRADFELWMERLGEALVEAQSQRPSDLAELDCEREADPAWFLDQRWVATMLYADRFAGDLCGVEGRIPYLKDLGVNYVHVMPVLKSREGENDGGYAVSDYRDVDPRFGTLGDLTRLASTLRREKMLLCLDVVLNHTADSHEWARRALAGEEAYQNFYYMYADRAVPDEFEKTLPEVFPELAPGNFTWKPEISRWIMTVFNRYQWDLNYTNPAVFVEMLRIILNLANLGVDVLRLDATPFLWKRIGTSSQNEPEAHLILQTMKACCRVVAPGTVFKSEAIVQPVEIIRYLGDAQTKECDIAYNASLMVYLWDALATKNTRLLVRGLENIPPIPSGTTWITYVRCHDDIGLGFSDLDAQSVGYTPALHRRFLIDYYTGKFPGSPAAGHPFMYNPKTKDARISGSCASLCGLEKARESGDPLLVELALRRILLLYGVVFSFGGIPLVYYGDELALCNDRSYESDPALKDDNRWMHRPAIDWKLLGHLAKRSSAEFRIREGIRRFARIRKESSEFSGGSPYQMMRNDNQHVFSFLRENEETKTLVLANFSEEDQWIDAGITLRAGFTGPLADRLSGVAPVVRDNAIRIPALSCLWLSDAGRTGVPE